MRPCGTAGFLLMETLATFTISAFVLLGLVSAASVLLRAVDVSVTHIERIDDLGRAMEAVRRDISQISRARWNGTEPQSYVFRGGPNSLYFAHATRGLDGARATEAVALREIVVAGTPTLVSSSARLDAHAASFDDLQFGPQHEIWTGVARLRFTYVPRREGHDEPQPSPSWPMGTSLPAAILVEAVDRDTRRVLVATRVTIEANADIGCLGDGEATPTTAGATTGAATSGVATTSATDPATQGSGGVDFGAIPQAEALPSPSAPSGASQQTGDSGGFCSQVDGDGDKPKPTTAPPAAVAGATP